MNTPHGPLEYSLNSPFKAKGRFSRLSFAAWSFVSTLAIIGMLLVISVVFGALASDSNAIQIFGSLLLIAIYVTFLVFSVIFIIRRLHDRNHNGWFAILFFVPIINLIFIIYLLCAKGDIETNRFGAPRATPSWERVMGWIYIVLMPIVVILGVSSDAMMAYQRYTLHSKQVSDVSQIIQPVSTHNNRLS
ncbi:DUF805 domain-containing protein [Acinetobacter baylyi]|uniref:DUF805 domain-containing protein n=1 Tax=Acinetobacter baylyi TaxID=202950 RepID=UPI0031D29D5C